MIFFFLIPHIDISKFRAESRNIHFHMDVSLPRPPTAHKGSYSAGGLVAAGGDDDGVLETIRHDNKRPAGMSQASLCRCVAEMRHK